MNEENYWTNIITKLKTSVQAVGKSFIENAKSLSDSRGGAVGAQQVRDLLNQASKETGENKAQELRQQAEDLAKQYAHANITGIALAGGAVPPNLVSDLAVTGAATLADTMIDGDLENLNKNLAINASADLLGRGLGKIFKYFQPKIQNLNNTEKLQLLLQNNTSKPQTKFTIDEIQLLKQYLAQNNVDVSKFTNDDLQLILNIRKQALQNTAPKQYVISKPNEFGFRNYFYDQSWNKKEPAGKIDILDLSGTKDLHIGGIQNLTQNSGSNKVLKGVSEPLYNSAIIVDKQTKNKGIITGEDWRSPKATEKILERYKDKQKVGQYGERYWEDGNITYGHDVYKFNQPTTQTPTKSLLFNPDIITDKGEMKPDWNDSDIFKTLIPLTFLYGTQNTNE